MWKIQMIVNTKKKSHLRPHGMMYHGWVRTSQYHPPRRYMRGSRMFQAPGTTWLGFFRKRCMKTTLKAM